MGLHTIAKKIYNLFLAMVLQHRTWKEKIQVAVDPTEKKNLLLATVLLYCIGLEKKVNWNRPSQKKNYISDYNTTVVHRTCKNSDTVHGKISTDSRPRPEIKLF